MSRWCLLLIASGCSTWGPAKELRNADVHVEGFTHVGTWDLRHTSGSGLALSEDGSEFLRVFVDSAGVTLTAYAHEEAEVRSQAPVGFYPGIERAGMGPDGMRVLVSMSDGLGGLALARWTPERISVSERLFGGDYIYGADVDESGVYAVHGPQEDPSACTLEIPTGTVAMEVERCEFDGRVRVRAHGEGGFTLSGGDNLSWYEPDGNLIGSYMGGEPVWSSALQALIYVAYEGEDDILVATDGETTLWQVALEDRQRHGVWLLPDARIGVLYVDNPLPEEGRAATKLVVHDVTSGRMLDETIVVPDLPADFVVSPDESTIGIVVRSYEGRDEGSPRLHLFSTD